MYGNGSILCHVCIVHLNPALLAFLDALLTAIHVLVVLALTTLWAPRVTRCTAFPDSPLTLLAPAWAIRQSWFARHKICAGS